MLHLLAFVEHIMSDGVHCFVECPLQNLCVTVIAHTIRTNTNNYNKPYINKLYYKRLTIYSRLSLLIIGKNIIINISSINSVDLVDDGIVKQYHKIQYIIISEFIIRDCYR